VVKVKELSDCEKQILCYLAMGLSEKEIANLVSRSYKTISNTKLSAMKKIDVKNNAELIKWLQTSDAKHEITESLQFSWRQFNPITPEESSPSEKKLKIMEVSDTNNQKK